MRSFAVAFVLMHVVFTAAAGSTKRVLASKCCPEGFALDEYVWECVEVLTEQTVDSDLTTLSRESVTDVTSTIVIVETQDSYSTDASQNYNAAVVTDGSIEYYTDTFLIVDTTAKTPEKSHNDSVSVDSIDEGNYLRQDESLTDLLARFPEGVPWLPPAFYNTLHHAGSSFVVRYASLQSLTCFQKNGTTVRGSQTDRYRLTDNGTFVLLSPNTRNGTSETTFSPSEYCVDVTNNTQDIVYILCPCRRLQCISKCCPEKEAFVCDEFWENCSCSESIRAGWDPFEYERAIIPNEITYEILSNNIPQCGEGEIYFTYVPNIPHHNSRFWVGYPRGRSYVEERVCGDYVYLGARRPHHQLMRCFEASAFSINLPKRLYLMPQAPAATLLAVALAASVFLPAPAKSAFGWAHGAALACHAAALLVLNATRATMLLVGDELFCPRLSFLVYFCQVAASFWLNVMCINIAWGFGMRLRTRDSKKSRTKLFLLYCAYAWGCPFALTGFTIFMWFFPNVPSYLLRPSLVETKTCYGEFLDSPGKLSSFSYYYGPMGGLLILNIVLCFFIIKRMRNMKKGSEYLRGNESDVHQDTSANRKSMFLYVKVLSLMGIFEIVLEMLVWVISTNHAHQYYLVTISSFVDLMRALSIFILCCCNRRVLRVIQARLRAVKLRLLLNCEDNTCREAIDCPRWRGSGDTTTSSSCNTVSTECEAGEPTSCK